MTVVNIATARAKRAALRDPKAPAWARDLETCCAYAAMLRANHAAEQAAVHYAAVTRGLRSWSEAEDLTARTDENNRLWDAYCGVLDHLAALPAADRRLATIKRNTIGRCWLACEGARFDRLRAGCLADDHHFPPSERLAGRKVRA